MCLSAIIWANIKKIYFVINRKEVADIGFRDDMIYNYLENKEQKFIKLKMKNVMNYLKVMIMNFIKKLNHIKNLIDFNIIF